MRSLCFLFAFSLFAQTPEGQRLFVANCSTCHGADAQGARGPDLTSGTFRHGSSADEIAKNIHDGIPGTAMPAFPLPGDQPRLIADWLLSQTRGKDTAITGDAASGSGIFFGAAGCAGCHPIKGAGKGFAPDLSNIGEVRSVDDLHRQIGSPGENARGGSRAVDVTTADGEHVRGLIVTENAFSLFVRDKDEKLHLISKSGIRQRTDLKTLMPKIALDARQIDDLVAFLKHPEVPAPDLSVWNPEPDFNVTAERLMHAGAEPQNWLQYWGQANGTTSATSTPSRPPMSQS